MGLVAAGALGATLVAWSFSRRAPPPDSRADRNAAAAAAPVASLERRDKFALRITAFPANAEVFLDGQRVATNPFSGEIPADGKEHEIRAEAPGFEPKATLITPSDDADVVLQLKAEATKPSGARRPAAKPTTKPSPATKPGVDCATPFYVDEHGIKKFKPGCI
jgi:serine/threonine-protein kinase